MASSAADALQELEAQERELGTSRDIVQLEWDRLVNFPSQLMASRHKKRPLSPVVARNSRRPSTSHSSGAGAQSSTVKGVEYDGGQWRQRQEFSDVIEESVYRRTFERRLLSLEVNLERHFEKDNFEIPRHIRRQVVAIDLAWRRRLYHQKLQHWESLYAHAMGVSSQNRRTPSRSSQRESSVAPEASTLPRRPLFVACLPTIDLLELINVACKSLAQNSVDEQRIHKLRSSTSGW